MLGQGVRLQRTEVERHAVTRKSQSHQGDLSRKGPAAKTRNTSPSLTPEAVSAIVGGSDGLLLLGLGRPLPLLHGLLGPWRHWRHLRTQQGVSVRILGILRKHVGKEKVR